MVKTWSSLSQLRAGPLCWESGGDVPEMEAATDNGRPRWSIACAQAMLHLGRPLSVAASISGTSPPDSQHSGPALNWDNDDQVLTIPDPYLLFYLRWSG